MTQKIETTKSAAIHNLEFSVSGYAKVAKMIRVDYPTIPKFMGGAGLSS